MMIVTGLALAGGVTLFATWVAAVTNIHQRWTMDELESWSNDLVTFGAHPSTLCMVQGCPSPWETETHGWRECARHRTARV